MVIRGILKSIAVLMLAAIVFLMGYLTVKYWGARVIILWVIALLVNLVAWVLSIVEDDYDDVNKIWSNINFTIYTAGIYWLVCGVIRLWKNAYEIEDSIKAKIKPKKIRQKNIKSGGKGALSVAENEGGELSL